MSKKYKNTSCHIEARAAPLPDFFCSFPPRETDGRTDGHSHAACLLPALATNLADHTAAPYCTALPSIAAAPHPPSTTLPYYYCRSPHLFFLLLASCQLSGRPTRKRSFLFTRLRRHWRAAHFAFASIAKLQHVSLRHARGERPIHHRCPFLDSQFLILAQSFPSRNIQVHTALILTTHHRHQHFSQPPQCLVFKQPLKTNLCIIFRESLSHLHQFTPVSESAAALAPPLHIWLITVMSLVSRVLLTTLRHCDTGRLPLPAQRHSNQRPRHSH